MCLAVIETSTRLSKRRKRKVRGHFQISSRTDEKDDLLDGSGQEGQPSRNNVRDDRVERFVWEGRGTRRQLGDLENRNRARNRLYVQAKFSPEAATPALTRACGIPGAVTTPEPVARKYVDGTSVTNQNKQAKPKANSLM